MTTDMSASIRASRVRVPRTRGAASGALLLVLGAWAALIPFFGPSFDFAFTPAPGDSWHWTAARAWMEVLPGAAAFAGGLLLLLSTSRVITSLGGWLAAAGGAWLVVGPALTAVLNLDLGVPDPSSSGGEQALEALLFFYAIGAAILFVASLALGRLSVHSLRDVRAAERRVAAEQAAAQEAAAAQQAAVQEAAAAQQQAVAEDRRVAGQRAAEQRAAEQRAAAETPESPGSRSDGVGRHGQPAFDDARVGAPAQPPAYAEPWQAPPQYPAQQPPRGR